MNCKNKKTFYKQVKKLFKIIYKVILSLFSPTFYSKKVCRAKARHTIYSILQNTYLFVPKGCTLIQVSPNQVSLLLAVRYSIYIILFASSLNSYFISDIVFVRPGLV